MKFTKINPKIQRALKQVLNKVLLVNQIVKNICEQRGTAYLVGGAVRDLFLERPLKDLDIEVHGLQPSELEKILKEEGGSVSFVGKAFGVYRVHGLDVDWSLPRFDKKGRKPQVVIDPYMEITVALRRRDVTINAMAINLHSFELIDPFGGLQDLHNKILRTPDETFFLEDPLRFYRVMQFIGRFDMYPDDALNSICAQMDLSGVSVERIEGEFEKLLLKSKEPSRGIRWLHAIGRLHEILPELADTISIAQDPVWHPEGDVFEHTMQTVDAAAVLEYNNDYEKLCVVYAALCHDLGKATTTEIVQERIHSYGHMRAGVALAKKMLKRITKKKDVIAAVAKLVRYHFEPIHFVENNAGPSAYKRLARKLAPEVSLQTLAKLALADQRGRNPKGNKPLSINVPAIKTFLQRAAQAAVLEYPEKSVLQGRDLLDVIKPGPKMGELLKRAYEIQLEEGIKNKDELKRRVLQKHMKN